MKDKEITKNLLKNRTCDTCGNISLSKSTCCRELKHLPEIKTCEFWEELIKYWL
jgi:hypothetical protein